MPDGEAEVGTAANGFNPLAWFVGKPQIGEGPAIGPFCLIDGSGGLTIGRALDIAAGSHCSTPTRPIARCTSDRAVDVARAPVAIGDHTFIGANAVVLMGVTIGSHCVIGAGSVVNADVPDCTAGGGSTELVRWRTWILRPATTRP